MFVVFYVYNILSIKMFVKMRIDRKIIDVEDRPFIQLYSHFRVYKEENKNKRTNVSTYKIGKFSKNKGGLESVHWKNTLLPGKILRMVNLETYPGKINFSEVCRKENNTMDSQT